MSVPSDKLMELMKGPQSAGTPVPDQLGSMNTESETPPMGAPMSTPEPRMGTKEAAMINIGMAQDLLEQALGSVGSDTAEGKAILSSISNLNKVLGPRKNKTNELQQSEIIQMLQSLPQAGGRTPESMSMAGAPAPGTAPTAAGPGMMPPPPGAMPPPPGGLKPQSM